MVLYTDNSTVTVLKLRLKLPYKHLQYQSTTPSSQTVQAV